MSTSINPEPRTIRLKGIGHHPAIEAQELMPGDTLVWDQGAKTTVTAVAVASPKFLRVTERSHHSGEVTTRRIMKTRLVARVTKPLSYSVGAAVAASGLELGDVVEYDERNVQGPDGPETVPAGRGPLRDAWLGGEEVVARVEREDGIIDAPPLGILRPAAGRTDEAAEPAVTPAEVAAALLCVADSVAEYMERWGESRVREVWVSGSMTAYAAFGVTLGATNRGDAEFAALRDKARRAGRLPHIEAVTEAVRDALVCHLEASDRTDRCFTPDIVRELAYAVHPAARTAELARQFPAGEMAVCEAEGEPRDVVLVKGGPAEDGTVEVDSARHQGERRVPLAALSPLPELPPEPEGKLTDWWAVFDRAGKEIARVQATMRVLSVEAAEAHPVAGPVYRREGGVATRRLRTSELATEVGTLTAPPRVAPPLRTVGTHQIGGRTVTVQAGFTRKSIPTRLRESGAPGQMISLPGGELRWRLPDGTELTPGQAAKQFLGD
ncbi:hypothetical protein [Streptomyces albidoflavus]|uniref:hypothetical protein n=1 Tax=Streptomyces albidoflavus TaxID=1886 RepID=UPI00188D954D|nr:hypothetical protein [Streptomyces albidoflavus]MBF4138245.1 hypothetical protein [Streptomyces albidoflavus]